MRIRFIVFKVNIIVLIISVFFNINLFSQTDIAVGNVSGTWLQANSPYRINGDITIIDTTTLTIEPGVVVEFQGHYKINVQGTLLAEGTQTDSIIFTINDTTDYSNNGTTAGSWFGIFFNKTPATNDTSIFAFCRVEYTKAVTYSTSDDTINSGGAFFIKDFSKVIIQNSVIRNNYVYRSGGGIYLNNASITIKNNKIYKNVADWGAGIMCQISDAEIINNIVCNNYSGNTGGGIYFNNLSGKIINNLICNNYAQTGGGLVTQGAVELTNNTISNNKAAGQGGGLFTINTEPVLINCILWGNTATEGNQIYLYDDDSDPDFTNCDIQGGVAAFGIGSSGIYTGNYTDNIDGDPVFIAQTDGSGTGYNGLTADWSLQSSTPCLNKGKADTTALNLPTFDIAGNQRIYNNVRVDIGAYEFQNNPPEISVQNFYIDENSANGTTVDTVIATDIDNNSLSYEITNGNTNNAFSIDTSGILKVANVSELNYETVTNHRIIISVTVTDNGVGNLSALSSIIINLNDANDAPVLDPDTLFVTENTPEGTVLCTLNGYDEDEPSQSLTYTKTRGVFLSNVNIDTHGRLVCSSNSFNYEDINYGTVQIVVEDELGAQNHAWFVINVSDTNDAPVIANQTFSIDEQSAVGSVVGTIAATDEDMPAQTLTFTVLSGNDNQTFTVNPATGVIAVNNPDSTDFELVQSQTITVQVTDNGTGNLFNSAEMTINFNNINDHAPVLKDTIVSLNENVGSNTHFLNFTPTDVDSLNSLEVTIESGNENNIFALYHSTANNYSIYVNITDSINYEQRQQFVLTLNVSDGDSIINALVTINVNDVNEAPSFNLNNYDFNLEENPLNNTLVGTIEANDPDNNQTLLYYIDGGNYNNTFYLDSLSGNIYISDSTLIDFEGIYPVWGLNVTVKDNGTPQLYAYGTVVFNLIDINEPPVIENQTFEFSEFFTVNVPIGTIIASEPDEGQSLTYEIIGGNDNNIFNINSTSGVLTIINNDSIDYETHTHYILNVKVTDNSSEHLSDSATITLNVLNVNEEPVIQPDTFYIDENSMENTVIDTVKATDPENNNITLYQIYEVIPYTNGAFNISNSGVLTVGYLANFDYESLNEYKLVVIAQDEYSATGHDTITVLLNDINEAPVIIDNQFASVDEHSPDGTVIDTVKALTDAGETLTFSIESGNLHNAFVIEAATGIITVQHTDSIDIHNIPVLVIKAMDNSSEHFSGTGDFVIYGNDVNDPPVINHQVFYFTDEYPYHGERIGYVEATDPENNISSFSIEEGDISSFLITQAGELQVNNTEAFTSGNISTFDLLIKVTDNEYSDTAIITVNLFPNGIIDTKFYNIADIYPNPVKNRLFIKLKSNKPEGYIKLFNINSKIVYSGKILISKQIDVSQLPAGIYFIQIISNTKTYITKIIVE